MARKTIFSNGEFYHVYNRGVDKRDVVSSIVDVERFLQGMEEFNVIEPIGSLYENSFLKDKGSLESEASKSKLVNIVAYCLNPNHYHFLLEQVVEKGVEKFMHRLGTGYTKYFNLTHQRTGSLFQGVFKSIHVDSNEYILHLSSYINLNNRVHQLGSEASKLVRSSWQSYLDFKQKNIITEQFSNAAEYQDFAIEALESIVARRREERELANMLLE